MKRFSIGLTSKSMVTTEEKITAYETWLQASHASYTLDRWRSFDEYVKSTNDIICILIN